MHLNPALLDGREHELRATLEAHGLYNAFHFVLRLSPLVHQRLSQLPTGPAMVSGLDAETLQAFSTYLHETVHWWQHIGTTHGLMRSLSYPVQAHANYHHLTDLLARGQFAKSLKNLATRVNREEAKSGLASLLNVIVNNQYDIEWFRQVTYSPQVAKNTVRQPLFECVGHSHAIAYQQNLLVVSTVADEQFEVLPDPREWGKAFAELKRERQTGFYYGSPLQVWPLGGLHILEGQARFVQLQYLYFASGGRADWCEAKGAGMLEGVYGEAFEVFLRLAELDWPTRIDHPTVGLFLVVCDMALNPGVGFPFAIRRFDQFVVATDPGARFAMLCRALAKLPALRTAVREYSRDEFVSVTEELAKAANCDSPLSILTECVGWTKTHAGVKGLMREHELFAYGERNMPIRLLFTHFLAFALDKHVRPEFFCWPGAHMAGARASQELADTFETHRSLFVDKEDDDGIFPALRVDRDQASVDDTFQRFYDFNVTYDMTRQWVMSEGPFAYEYAWLSQRFTREELQSYADKGFRALYGVEPANAKLVYDGDAV
jgi:hypothetical protein